MMAENKNVPTCVKVISVVLILISLLLIFDNLFRQFSIIISLFFVALIVLSFFLFKGKNWARFFVVAFLIIIGYYTFGNSFISSAVGVNTSSNLSMTVGSILSVIDLIVPWIALLTVLYLAFSKKVKEVFS